MVGKRKKFFAFLGKIRNLIFFRNPKKETVESQDSALQAKLVHVEKNLETIQIQILQGWAKGLFLSFCFAGFIVLWVEKTMPAIAEEIIDLDQQDLGILKELAPKVGAEIINPVDLPALALPKAGKPLGLPLPIIPAVPVIVNTFNWTFFGILGAVGGILTGILAIYGFRWMKRKQKKK